MRNISYERFIGNDGKWHHSVEKTKKYINCVGEVDRKVEEKLALDGIYRGQLGFAIIFFSEKAKILKEEYDIEWLANRSKFKML